MGMFLRRGSVEKPVQTVDVIISGDTNAYHAYVEIDGTKYTETGTYAILVGATAIVHCYNTIAIGGTESKIVLNGTIVATATKNIEDVTYSFPIQSTTTILFTVTSILGSSENYSCNITTS